MEIAHITDPQTWDQALLSLPNPHVLQSWTWGQIKGRYGWQPSRLLFQDGGHTVAAACILQRRVPVLPYRVCYVPKGPILDWGNTDLAARVLAELEAVAGNQGALFIKIDPDVYYREESNGPPVSSRPVLASQIKEMLTSRGWAFSDEQIQFRNTALVDLDRPEDDILAAMKQKSRYNVRLAGRRGVTIRQGSADDLNLFYQLYAETAQRDGFIIRPLEYYLDAWGSFMEQGLAHLLLAEVEGEIVAGLVLFTFGVAAWYMYGASSSRHRKHMPNHLLQWEAIRQAKSVGCSLYDLWGAPDELDESDPMWGVYRFKLGLGGQLARGLGAWDFPTNRIGYRLYSTILPRYLELQRKRHRAGQGPTSDND